MALRGAVTSNRAGQAGTAAVETASFPVGAAVGDRIAVIANINNNTSTLVAQAGANTWTATASSPYDVSTTLRVYLFERTLDATDIATGVVTFTWSGTGTPGRIQCGGLVFTAGDAVTPFGAVQVATSSLNTATAPAFTTASPSADVYMLIGARVAASNFTGVVVPPAAFTEDTDVITTVATNANIEVSACHLTSTVAAGSSVGGGALTSGSQATHWVIFVNELRAVVPVSTSRATTWDTLASVSTTRATTWVTRAVVAASRATSWNALASVSAQRATTWVTREVVSTSRATSWDVLTPVTAVTRQTSWDTLEAVTAERVTGWDCLAPVIAARDTAWDVLSVVGTSRATSWDVITPTEPPAATPAERVAVLDLGDRTSAWTLPSRTSTMTLGA